MALVGNILLGTGSAPGLSSIASAYAESAASSRIPWSALEYSGETITAISGSSIGGQGGGDTSQCMPKSASADFILTSQSSQFITSTAGLQPSGDYAFNSALSSYLPKSASGDFAPSGDYAYNSALSAYAYESSVSAWTAKQDALTFGYSGSYISSINGSAIADTTAGGGGGVVTATGGSDGYVTSINGSGLSGAGGGGGGGDYVPTSATEVAIGTSASASQGHYASALSASVAQGYSAYANGYSVAQGTEVSASSNSFVQGCLSTASVDSLAQGYHSTAERYALAQGEHVSAYSASLAQGNKVSASNYSIAQGHSSTARNDSFAQGWGAVAVQTSVAQGDNCSASSHYIAIGVSSTANDWGRTFGLNLTAEHSATVFGQYNNKGNGRVGVTGDSAAFVIGDGTSTAARHDLMLVTKDGEITMFSSTSDTTGIPVIATLRSLSAAVTILSSQLNGNI